MHSLERELNRGKNGSALQKSGEVREVSKKKKSLFKKNLVIIQDMRTLKQEPLPGTFPAFLQLHEEHRSCPGEYDILGIFLLCFLI